MRLSRFPLVLAALLALPLLVLGALLLLLRFGAFDASIARTLSRSLATPVAFDHLGLSLLPGPRVALEGLRVGDARAGAPLVDGARVAVALPWRALRGDFSRQRAVTIDAGQLNLRIDAAGHDNWSALVERVLDLVGEGPAAFRVDALGTKDRWLRFEDARSGLRFAIGGFSMTAADIAPRAPFPQWHTLPPCSTCQSNTQGPPIRPGDCRTYARLRFVSLAPGEAQGGRVVCQGGQRRKP